MAVIPENYQNSGKLLNGLISTRNAIETCAVVPALVAFEFICIPLYGYAKLIMILFTCVPVLILTAFGIAGDSFTQRMSIIFRFYRRRRKLHYKRD